MSVNIFLTDISYGWCISYGGSVLFSITLSVLLFFVHMESLYLLWSEDGGTPGHVLLRLAPQPPVDRGPVPVDHRGAAVRHDQNGFAYLGDLVAIVDRGMRNWMVVHDVAGIVA